MIVPVRLPAKLRREVWKKARGEDLDFSKYVRRALRRELANAEALVVARPRLTYLVNNVETCPEARSVLGVGQTSRGMENRNVSTMR